MRETALSYVSVAQSLISIHFLRVEGDESFFDCWHDIFTISIHSLRVEGDECLALLLPPLCDFNPLPPCGGRPESNVYSPQFVLFQSTPSVWRETGDYQDSTTKEYAISIHSLRVEGDYSCFYGCFISIDISIHSLRVEGDGDTMRDRIEVDISIHSLRVEGDLLHRPSLHLHSNFNPLPPCGGRPL